MILKRNKKLNESDRYMLSQYKNDLDSKKFENSATGRLLQLGGAGAAGVGSKFVSGKALRKLKVKSANPLSTGIGVGVGLSTAVALNGPVRRKIKKWNEESEERSNNKVNHYLKASRSDRDFIRNKYDEEKRKAEEEKQRRDHEMREDLRNDRLIDAINNRK